MKKGLLIATAMILIGSVVAHAETYEGQVVKAGKMFQIKKPGAQKGGVIANVMRSAASELEAYEGKVVKVTGSLHPDREFATLQTIDSVEVISE